MALGKPHLPSKPASMHSPQRQTPPMPTAPLSLPPRLTAPVNLLLQNDTVHARLEQRKDQTRLALQLAQAVEDICRRRAG
jgi:hypothetical protein